MGDRLKGKVAVIAGAGRGLGRAMALLMADEGASVVVNDLGCATDGSGASAELADEVVGQIRDRKGIAVASHDSVTTMEGGEKIVGTAVDNFGRLDILVNSAGSYSFALIENMTEAEWDARVVIHLKGPFICIKCACAVMKQQRSGRIINLASESGLGHPGAAHYSAAKEGLLGLTRTVAHEMRQYGITCNAIRPRAVTETAASGAREMYHLWRNAKVPIPAFFWGSSDEWRPEDVAPFVVYLATDQAAGINGYDFLVYGQTVSLMSQPQAIRSIYSPSRWTVDELMDVIPKTLSAGLVNPAPPIKEA